MSWVEHEIVVYALPSLNPPFRCRDSTSSTSSSWFGSFVNSVSHSVQEAVATVSTDLNEFVGTIQHDTAEAVDATREQIRERSQAQDGSVTGNVKATMAGLAAAITATIRKKSNEASRSGTRSKSEQPSSADVLQLKSICMHAPVDDEHFDMWLEGFDTEHHAAEITSLMSDDDTVRKLHTELVPKAVSYRDFWARLFYHWHQAKVQEERRAALLQRMSQQDNDANDDDLSFADWDDDDEVVSPQDNTMTPTQDADNSSGLGQDQSAQRHGDNVDNVATDLDMHDDGDTTYTSATSVAQSTSATVVETTTTQPTPQLTGDEHDQNDGEDDNDERDNDDSTSADCEDMAQVQDTHMEEKATLTASSSAPNPSSASALDNETSSLAASPSAATPEQQIEDSSALNTSPIEVEASTSPQDAHTVAQAADNRDDVKNDHTDDHYTQTDNHDDADNHPQTAVEAAAVDHTAGPSVVVDPKTPSPLVDEVEDDVMMVTVRDKAADSDDVTGNEQDTEAVRTAMSEAVRSDSEAEDLGGIEAARQQTGPAADGISMQDEMQVQGAVGGQGVTNDDKDDLDLDLGEFDDIDVGDVVVTSADIGDDEDGDDWGEWS
eukprot:TRINITY_DN7913_c0_g1_i1.p1 TRINITY_DN7913_c0_g1~~TRINITY_DN7913_c0_g1_i1.p1  ORF type:complete len:627 (+),score=200.90 TRINITY_DN7913_c0_g1_i1:62-1882(+)